MAPDGVKVGLADGGNLAGGAVVVGAHDAAVAAHVDEGVGVNTAVTLEVVDDVPEEGLDLALVPQGTWWSPISSWTQANSVIQSGFW